MATPPPHFHHHHCHSQVATPTAGAATCCFSCSSYNQIPCCAQPHNHSPPQPTQASTVSDPLLRALASLVQQQLQPPNVCSPYAAKPSTQNNRHQNLHFPPQKNYFQNEDQQHQQTQFVLSSLIQRIGALESSLHHISTSGSPNCYSPSYSLRDTAARVIQSHFRAFLVRRSRTLRQLQDLAFIKSSFNSLRSSISTKPHFDSKVVSHKATDLLLKLESIQGGDPMIRDGKRSISRDLLRFLEFIDGLAVQRHGSSHRNARYVRFVGNTSNNTTALNDNDGYGELNGNQRERVVKLRERVEKLSGYSRACENKQEDVELEGFQQLIDDDEGEHYSKDCFDEQNGFSNARKGVLVRRAIGKPKVKKSVSFDESGNVYRVINGSPESYLNEGFIITNDNYPIEDNRDVLENPFDETE